MDLYRLHTRVLMPFVSGTIGALSDMANLTATAGQPFQDDLDGYSLRAYAVCVTAKSREGVQGKITMNHPKETALQIGNQVRTLMLGEPSSAKVISEDVRDALMEFGNTIVGLATDALRRAQVEIQFSAPLFVSDDRDWTHILDGVQEIMSVPITIANTDTFHFSYLLHRKTR